MLSTPSGNWCVGGVPASEIEGPDWSSVSYTVETYNTADLKVQDTLGIMAAQQAELCPSCCNQQYNCIQDVDSLYNLGLETSLYIQKVWKACKACKAWNS